MSTKIDFSNIRVQDEGNLLPRRGNIDFVGAGVIATDDLLNDKTIVTIAGGGAGASGIFGIADATGVYTYYSNLGLAIAAATAGETIQLFTDYTETVVGSIFLKNGVDINLNGHTYEYAVANNSDTISDGGIPATVTIFNGTLKRTNALNPTNTTGVCLKLSNVSTNITLHGVTVIAEDGSNCCIVQNGKLLGGYYRQIGAVAGSSFGFQTVSVNSFVDNVHVHADTKAARLDSGKVSNSYFRNDGDVGVIVNSGEAYNIIGFSTATTGILVATAKLFNSSGISTAQIGLATGTSTELYNCSGTSSAGVGIFTLNYAINCVAISTGSFGMGTGSFSSTHNCSAYSSANVAIFSRGKIVKTSAICDFDSSSGHGFSGIENNDEIIDCYAEVVNSAAYGVNAPIRIPYVTGFSGRGMTQLLNLGANAQVNTADNYGNILIG